MHLIELPLSDTSSTAISLFDPVRKKYVFASPEEVIRQSVIRYLMENKNFPKALLGIEVSLMVNRLKKRCDIVAYKNSQPMMLVECKAPSVKIDQNVFDQIARYNLSLAVPYLVVTNGNVSYCCRINFEKRSFEFLNTIPDYKEL